MEFPAPFRSRWHTTAGHRLHYVDEGGGEAVVMLHGNPTWSFYYRRLIAALRGDYRVIAPDHMGMGLSDKPEDYPYTLQTHIDNLAALLDSAVPAGEGMTIIAHDWGGAIGMGYAVRCPVRVKRLVIFNSAAFLGNRVPWLLRLARAPLVGVALIRGLNLFARGAIWLAVANPRHLDAEARAGYLRPYGSWRERVGIYRFVQDIPVHPRVPSHSVLQAIAAKLPTLAPKPMLIQWGGRDWCFDREILGVWRRFFPNAEVDVYEDAGHYVLEEAGEQIVPRVRAFLAAGQAGEAPI